MITKLNIEKIADKLSDKKLELERVELALPENIQKQIGIVKQFNSQLQKQAQDYEKLGKSIAKEMEAHTKEQQKADKFESQGFKERDLADKLAAKIEKAAENLGVNPSAVKGYSSLKKAAENVEESAIYVSDVKDN